MRKQERKKIEIAVRKSEAAQQKPRNGKQNNKTGKNKNFLNGLRKDLTCIPYSSEGELKTADSKAGVADTANVDGAIASQIETTKSKKKDRRKAPQKEETLPDESKGTSAAMKLTNSLIYELD